MYFGGGEQHDRKPAIGLDISGGGVRLLTKDQIESQGVDVPVVVLIADRPVQLAAKLCWTEPTQHQGQPHYLAGLKLSKIADHEWDRIMEWTIAEDDPNSKLGLKVGQVLSDGERDTLVPIARQVEISKRLAEKGRLDPVDGGRLPLIEYKFEGYKMRKGIAYYKLTVRSKKTESDRSFTEYRTSVLARIEQEGVVVLD